MLVLAKRQKKKIKKQHPRDAARRTAIQKDRLPLGKKSAAAMGYPTR